MITEAYYGEIQSVLKTILETQKENIIKASELVYETMTNDGIIYIFGCGHSHLVGLDSFYRAGGLANVSAVLDTDLMLHNGAAKSSALERMSGISDHILERYCITSKDTLFVVSTSGINGVPVEAAEYGVRNNIKTVAVTSMAYENEKSRHNGGKHLYEAADMYIDTCVPHGDAVIKIGNEEVKMGSLSTEASTFILQSVLMEAAERFAKDGGKPPVYMSGNVSGGAEYNRSLIKKYLPRVKHL